MSGYPLRCDGQLAAETLEARLSVESELGARTSLLCEAWRRVHCLCQHSATTTHPHLISWLQRHTAQTILQSEWRQLSINQDKHDALGAAIDFFILECHEAIITREGANPQWETQLLQRAQWFKSVIPDPWGNAVLKALLDPNGEAPSDQQIIEWLREERGVFFVTRLRQLAASKKTVDIALSLATAVMERVRACAPPVSDAETPNVEQQSSAPTFTDTLTIEAGFTVDVWELITDIEFVLLYSDRSKCIALAKKTPLKNGYQLVERLHCRLDVSSREKRLWKNAKDVAILIAQVMIARCMVVPTCVGTARSTLYGCSRSLVKLLSAERLPAAMAALAAPAATARHLHMLALAVDAQCQNERKPFVCELYIRAITAGMNELEKLKLTKEKESEARMAEKILSSWFTSLGALLGASARLAYECALTAFSLHPSPAMYERIRTAPQLQPPPVHKDIQEPAIETNSEFGSWATDSRSQTNFVKTSETLNLKKIQQHSNVLSTAVLNEGETLGLSPDLCQDLIVLLSGPRVKTLSWDMDKEILIENCRSYMERTHGGTRALTTELKYLNLAPDFFMHLPEEEDEDESDIYYGIEKGYEHLVELHEPEEIWEDALSDTERTESCYSTENETLIPTPKGRKKGKPRRHSFSIEEEILDPLSDTVSKIKHRSHSSESNNKSTKERSKERSKERKKKEGQPRDTSSSKIKSNKDNKKSQNINEEDSIAIDVNKFLQKPKKERKKKEKKEKKDLQTQTTTTTGLSRFVGKKIIKTNMLNIDEQITKRETETDLNNQVFITDSDYDSQGKSSIASMHTEGNDPDVLFDGLFSMDDIKSPEKTTVTANNKTYPLQFNSDNSVNRQSLIDSETKASPNIKIPNPCYMRFDEKDKEMSRPSSAPQSLARNEISQSPSGCSSNPCQNETIDEVKLGIKRLIEFRKQKSATDLINKTKHESELEYQAVLNKTKTCTVNKNLINKYGLANTMDNESRILSGSPKAISVPDIPKVFINKKQSQQLNHLKNEVDNYLLSYGNCIESQAYPLNTLKKLEMLRNTDELTSKSVKSDKSAVCTNLNKFENKLFNMFQRSERSKVTTSNVPNTPLFKESFPNTKYNHSGKNASNPNQIKLHDFLKELHRSNNAGVIKNNSRVGAIKTGTESLHSSILTNYSAKQIKPSKKVENVPNTFARLKYMHQNKQGDNVCKQNNDHVTQNKLHKSSHPESIKDKNDIIDTLLSRVDCTVIRKVEKTSQKKGNSSKDSSVTTGIIDGSQTVTKKAVTTDDRLIIKSNLLQSQHTRISSVMPTESTRTTVPKPMLADCNEDQVQNLLRQNSKCFVSRPQINTEGIINKGVSSIQVPTSSLPLNPQSLCQQLGDEIYNRLQGCPIKIQPCQSAPSLTQNAVTVQPKSSSITKTKEVCTKRKIRHKSAIVNTKETKNNAKRGIKNDIVQQDWESVLNDLLSHKTPARGSNTHSSVIKKDKKLMPNNNLCNQKINNLESSNKINNHEGVVSEKLGKDLNIVTALKQNRNWTQQKSIVKTNTSMMNISQSYDDALVYASKNAFSEENQPFISKPSDQSSLKKSYQTAIIKKLGKTPEVRLPIKKDLKVGVPQSQADLVISNVPTSEYDILGELMDDDLRQEIGELSSDEESVSTTATNTIPKGKLKILSTKLLNLAGCPDSSCNLNIHQNPGNTNKKPISILQKNQKVSEAQVRSMTVGYETVNVVKSKPLSNTIYKHDNEKCQTTTQKTMMYNGINQASKPITASNVQQYQEHQFLANNNGIINQSHILDSITTNNCNSLKHNVQQIGINCNNQNTVNDNPRLVTSISQNSGNVFNAVPHQLPHHPVVKNVVLIRPEIVYEPYTVQVHQIPKTVNSNISNLNANTFVAVNAIPAISMIGTQFSNPVISPLIIGKPIGVPITKNTTSTFNTGNNNNTTYPQLHTANGVNNSETEKHSITLESNSLNNVCEPNSMDQNTRNPKMHSLSKNTTSIDNLITHISRASVKINESVLRKDLERKVLTEIPENHNENLPCAIKRDAKEPEKPISEEYRHNDLDSSQIQNTAKDSTLNLLLNGQHTAIDDVVLPCPDTDFEVKDCILNKNSEKKIICRVQEKHNVTALYYTADNIDPEKSSAKCMNRGDNCGPSKVQSVSENSISQLLCERSTMVSDAGKPVPKSDIKVTGSVLHKNVDRNTLSKRQESVPTAINNLDLETSSAECGFYCNSFGLGKVENTSNNSISHLLSDCCNLADEVVAPYSKTDVNVNDDISRETYNEKKLLPEVQENPKLRTPCYIPTSVSKFDTEKSTECRYASDGATINSNSFFSTGYRANMTDIINHKPKTDVKLSECPPIKSCERKVLSEVQEKLKIELPEKNCSKTSIGTEDEIKKEYLKTQEERITRKKTAILNRQVHIFSNVEPIPLTYAPINVLRAVTDHKQKHIDSIGINDFVSHRKMQTLTAYDDAIATEEYSVSKAPTLNNIDDNSDIFQENAIEIDSFPSELIDVLKENNESNTTDCIRVRLRSSNKEVDNLSVLPENEKFDNRAKIKVKKNKAFRKVYKFKATKRLTRKRYNKIENNELANNVSSTKDITDQSLVIPVAGKNLDIEEHLQGSVISKPDLIKTKHLCTEVPTKKDNIQNPITIWNKFEGYSVHDHQKSVKSDDKANCNVEAFFEKSTAKETTNKGGKLKNTSTNHMKVDSPVNCIIPCDLIKNTAQVSNKIVTSNGDNENVSKEISMTKKQSLQSESTGSYQQVRKNVTCENDENVSNLSRRAKSRHETLDHNKIIDSYKDNIIIEELPRKTDDDPLKRVISIKLANGNSFKATVSGKLQVDINALFEDPTIRSVLMNNIPSNSRCILNIQQVISASGENVKTRVLPPKEKYRPLETINLISDDEGDNEPQVFNTEFGKFKVRGLDDSIFNNHQKRFSQKCSVKIQKHSKVDNKSSMDLDNRNEVNDLSSVNRDVSERILLENTKLHKVSDSTEDKNLQIIEIDDSSNDSIDTASKSNDVGIQPLNTLDHIEFNIKELKETLLKDLCVDINNKNVDTNIQMDLENIKETLLKDLCDDLENIDNDRLYGKKNEGTDVLCDLKGICHKALLENSSVSFTSSDIKSTDDSLKHTESKFENSSTVKDLFMDSTRSKNVSAVKSLQDIGAIFTIHQNKLPQSKKCQVKIEKCDDLARIYQLMKSKQCFVSLERCDRHINSELRRKSKKDTIEVANTHLSIDEHTFNNTETLFISEIDSSNCTLIRSESYSILNEINLYDQSLELPTPTECNTTTRIINDKCDTLYVKINENYENFYICQSDWFMTKSRFNCIMKQISPIKIISDDISTDCDSDLDDNCSNISETILDSIEIDKIPLENITYQVPSLMQLAFKFCSTTHKYLDSTEMKLSRTNYYSLQHLKRKLHVPNNVVSDRKLMRLDEGIKYHALDKECSNINRNEILQVDSSDMIQTIDEFTTRNYDNDFKYHGATPPRNIQHNIQEVVILPLIPNSSCYDSGSVTNYKLNNLNNKHLENNFENRNINLGNIRVDKADVLPTEDTATTGIETNVLFYEERHPVLGELTKISSTQDQIQGVNNLGHLHSNTVLTTIIDDNVSSKKDETAISKNLGIQNNKNIVKGTDCMSREIIENKNDDHARTSDEVRECCENVTLNFNSTPCNHMQQNDIVRSKYIENIYSGGLIVNERNNYSSIDQIQPITTDEYAELTTDTNTAISNGVRDTTTGTEQCAKNGLDNCISMNDIDHADNNYKNTKTTRTHTNSTGFDVKQVGDNNSEEIIVNKVVDTSIKTKFYTDSSKMCNVETLNIDNNTVNIPQCKNLLTSNGNSEMDAEKNKSANLLRSNSNKSDLTNSANKIVSENDVFNQQSSMDNCNIYFEEHKQTSTKSTKECRTGVDIYQIRNGSNNEVTSNRNVITKCDNKVSIIRDSSELYRSRLEPEQNIALDMDGVVTNENNSAVTSSMSSTSDAKFIKQFEHIEEHSRKSQFNTSGSNNIIEIDNNCNVYNDEIKLKNMIKTLPNSNQTGRSEIGVEKITLMSFDHNTHAYIESFDIHKEKMKSDKRLISTKHEENKVISKSTDEITNLDKTSVVLGTIQSDNHILDITHNTKVNNVNNEMKAVVFHSNQLQGNHCNNYRLKNNELVSISETENFDVPHHPEQYNVISKPTQSNLVSTNDIKEISEINKDLDDKPTPTNIVHDVNETRSYNKNGSTSGALFFKQLPPIHLQDEIHKSELDNVISQNHESIAIQRSSLIDNELLPFKECNAISEPLLENLPKNSNIEVLLKSDKINNCSGRNLVSEKCIPKHNIENVNYIKDNETLNGAGSKILGDTLDLRFKGLDGALSNLNESHDDSKSILYDVQSKHSIVKKHVNNDNIVLMQKNSTEIFMDSFEDKSKCKVIENNLNKSYGLSDNEGNIKTDETSFDEDKDITEIEVSETQCPKNITLLYQSDSKVILKGSIIENPIVGTCYVFPIMNSEVLRPVTNNNGDYINQEKTVLPDICNDLFQDTDLIVTKPKVTYSKTDLKYNYFSKHSSTSDKTRRSLKRKIESVDSKIIHKKYRKGKNIDHPKITVASVRDFGYTKEFKNLSNYCDSIKFSYTKQYHLIHLDDVDTMLKDWPIKESSLCASNVNETECNLFIDIEQRTFIPDPTKQTLAEEILTIYDEKESPSPVINETNFSMGFGEGSGRVDQNLIDGEKSIKISAVTLSDVKQSQPFLQSGDNDISYTHECRDAREKQLRVLDKCYSYIKLRDQVQSFFRKTTAELNYTWLKHNLNSEKNKSNVNDLLDTMSNFPFDLNITDYFEPPLVENIVQVVQVGQLPLSTGAQNPVTCDPRVTQVSDADSSQCSLESDIQPIIKTEYTELTTADISLPLMSDYDQHRQGLISASPTSDIPVCNDNITIETEVKIEVVEEVPESTDEESRYDGKEFPTFSSEQITDTEYSFDVNDIKMPIKTEDPDVKIVFEPAEGNVDLNQVTETYEIQQHQQKVALEKPDQLAHAMNAAGITTTPETTPDSAMDLSNSLSRTVCSETDGNNYQRSNITAMTLQHALAQILPNSLNQSSESESHPPVSVASQILHIVHGKNNSLNQIALTENTQQSVISTATPTPVLHIVQSKNGPTSSTSNGSPVHNTNSYGGLSLVDTGLSKGGNQLLHIVNTGNQKSNNGAQLLKRVNLLTNLTNVQSSTDQKMLQFVCKSADPKGIQLNTNQRSMVLRLHPIESPQSTPSKPECQDLNSRESPTKESIVPQELKSRSVYEENYAKFIQNSNKQSVVEKSTSLPKFNQAFGKPVFQEDNQKTNVIEGSNSHLTPESNNIENNECQSTDNSLHLENIRQIASPPLLLRKPSSHTAAQQNLVQQLKQAITPMNIQTMHGGVIYTRQIPVNIGGGQTINLITVPSTERIDDSAQKQKTDMRSRSEIEPSIIKIVPQSPASSNSEMSPEESNNSSGVSNENAQNSQPQPMLTQMRIKLPMLSKNPPMVSAARVVRPSFFQIQRNVIGGPNQPVYQQLVLTTAPTLGQQTIRLPHAQTCREMKACTESQSSPESQMSSSTLEQLREFDMVLEQVKERSTVQPNGTPAHDFSKSQILSNDTPDSASKSTPSEATPQVLYSIGNNQSVNVAYVNRKSTVVSTSPTTSFARSPDSSNIVESPTSSSHASSTHAPLTVTSESTNGTHHSLSHHKSNKISTKPKPRPKSHHPQFKMNPLPPKPNQKPMEDEQTTQRILYILAEYKEQVENSPDKDKPAPRRRTNLQASVNTPGGSKRKKSSSGSRRNGRDSSPFDDNCRTMGSEDSSCGTSQGDCSETCQELHSPQGSPRKVVKKLSFDHDSPASQSRPPLQQSQPQPHQSQLHKQPQPQPHLQRNVLVTDGPTIAVTRATPGKPATAVLMPANYILPVSMVKSGQQIAIVTNRGPKILTVGGGEGGTTNALLLQRLISPTGLKPVITRPGVRHVRLPTTALHNLQTFNLATAASAHQTTETATSPVPATSPPELIDATTPHSPWTTQDSEAAKQDQDSSPEHPEQQQEPEPEPEPERVSNPDPDPEPWDVPHDYSYEETVRTEMDRTVLVVQRRDGVTNRHRFVSAATLRQKFALMEDELRLQKSLSEECEDLGVDSPSASDLFPEAELLFSSSPAHEVSHHSHIPQPVILNQSSGISKPDLDDHAATDQLISRENGRIDRQTDEIDLGLEDVGIVTVSEDGMRATISLDHEEFVRSHPNTTFHSELTEEGEVQPVTLADLKARHITSTIFHAGRAPATVLVTAPQTTVISQATPDGSGVDHVRCSHADSLSHDGVTNRFDILNEPREISNSTSAIIHSTGNTTQVIRRVCYERNSRYFLDDDLMGSSPKMDDNGDAALDSVDDDRSSPERHPELFWENSRRRENRRLDFSSDSDKCCKSPYEENDSTDSSIGVNMRLDSVIKDTRGIDRSDSNVDDGNVPPLRTYPPKRTYHDGHRSTSGRSKNESRFTDSSEGKRRASNRGVVKRGCHCCNGTPAPPKPKKPRHRKPNLDFN